MSNDLINQLPLSSVFVEKHGDHSTEESSWECRGTMNTGAYGADCQMYQWDRGDGWMECTCMEVCPGCTCYPETSMCQGEGCCYAQENGCHAFGTCVIDDTKVKTRTYRRPWMAREGGSMRSITAKAEMQTQSDTPPAAPPECPKGYQFSYDTGWCCEVILGCTDYTALNYDQNATEDDGTCIHQDCVEPICPPGTVYDHSFQQCVEIGSTGPDHPQISYPTKPDRPPGGIADLPITPELVPSVWIGNKLWMTENLRTTHYNNGDPIPTGFSDSEWVNLDETETGAYAVYDDNESNADTYGYLYNWYVVNDPRGICPDGWHVPIDEEWMILSDYLGGSNVAGGKMKEAGYEHWWEPNIDGTNESGFTGLPGGFRTYYSGNYSFMGYYGWFWSSTEYNNNNAWYRKLGFNHSEIYRSGINKQMGYSVRCVTY